MGRPKAVYRGKRRYGWIATLALFIAAAAIIAGVWIFYDMQKYIEYEKDGIRLVLQDDSEQPTAGPDDDIVTAEPVTNPQVVIAMPDLASVESMVQGGLGSVMAMHVGQENVKAGTLDYYTGILKESQVAYNALVLDIKTEDGILSYFSTQTIASSYGVNGTEKLEESLKILKDDNIWLIAEVSCLVDNAMAMRNSPIALRDVGGNILTTEEGSWLDPYNPSVREYIVGIMQELKDMGFDEVLFTNMSFPNVSAQFSQAMTAAPDGLSSIAALAKHLRQSADEIGIRISAVIDGEAFRGGNSASIGQNAEFFLKVFDRVYVDTDIDHYVSDTSSLKELAGSNSTGRIVTMVEGFTPTADSFFTK